MRKLLTLIGLSGMLVFLLSSCASMQPLSNYARNGDTVAISLGGTEENAQGSFLKKENIEVWITDNDVNTSPQQVRLRYLVRLYADPTSRFSYKTSYQDQHYSSYYPDPNQGLWLAIIDLVDPITGELLTQLAEGPAFLNIISDDINTSGDLSNIPIEILPGTGSPNKLNYYHSGYASPPMSLLEASRQIEVSVDGTPESMIGSATYILKYLNSNYSFHYQPLVTKTTPDPNVQLAWGVKDLGGGTRQLTVTMVNPHGFNIDNDKSRLANNLGSSLLRSLRFNIAWGDYPLGANWEQYIWLDSAEFFDTSGHPMTELEANAVKLR